MAEARQRLSEKSADKAMEDAQMAAVEATKIVDRSMPSAKPAMVAALHYARFMAAYDDIMAVRVAKQKGFVDAMYQTEKSHVPFPDEPPIVYPDAEVWKELTATSQGEVQFDVAISRRSPSRKEDRRSPEGAYHDRIRRDAAEGRRRLSQGPAPHRDPARFRGLERGGRR